MHRNTREWVIRNNLFIKEKTGLNPYITADNERHLRSLEFIQDARILVKRIPNEPDSIDLIVVTKDLFSISGELNDASTSRFKAKVGEANVLGMGQKVQIIMLQEKKRDPHFGSAILYSKNNIANTFINATAYYTNINSDLIDGTEDEHAWYLSFDRPLVSQYSHVAGNLTIGQNQSYNNYSKPDSFFYKYHYNTFDAWIGYNLRVKEFLKNTKLKDRKFISIRYFRNKFSQTPFQIDDRYNFKFNDRQAVLAQFTFFRQNFF